MPRSVGSAFTGQDDEEPPLRSVMSNVHDQILGDPASRSALLQIGLNLMQPSWNTTAGQIGQAVGAGGEAVGRVEAANLKEEQVAGKLAQAEAMMAHRERMGDIAERRAMKTGLRELTEYQKAQLTRQQGADERAERREARTERRDTERLARDEEKDLNAEARAAYKTSRDLATSPDDPDLRFKTKTLPEIKETLRAERQGKKQGGVTEPVAPSGATPTKTATDANGNRIGLINGKWVPIK